MPPSYCCMIVIWRKKKKYDIHQLFKYFENIDVYSKASIFYFNKKYLVKIYDYLFHPWILRLLGESAVYGFQSTVDRLTHLAIVAGFKKIVFVGVDLNDSSRFWDEMNLDKKIKEELDRLIDNNKASFHSTEQKEGIVSASEIIKLQYQYAYSKGIKFYTTSKKSKLSLFLPIYKFKKINHEKKIDLNNLTFVKGADYPVILLGDKFLSNLISWDIKKNT